MDFTNGENLFGMFSVVIEIKVHTNSVFFFVFFFLFFFALIKIKPIMYTVRYKSTNLRKVIVCFVVVTIVCFQTKLVPDKPTLWQKL